ncbi:hypothetical protein C8F04DRAFT_1182407 [Mycena alexandri]|uniref:Uncharacterized protein n=1 Tax=Mycena alexandri TaxID=1745969 RepID=A0AAD6X4H5_9AGAR|nr:hypothetical protein C8F04DRAFT_1182407 [Mycena alexandri]
MMAPGGLARCRARCLHGYGRSQRCGLNFRSLLMGLVTWRSTASDSGSDLGSGLGTRPMVSGFVFGTGTGSALHLFLVHALGLGKGHLEDRWREEEREMGMAWACPGWEVERSRVEEERGKGKGGGLRDRDKVEYTPAMETGEGKGSDHDEPEYIPAAEMGAHLAGVQEAEGGRGGADEAVGAREAIEEERGGCAVGPSGGVDVGVGGCIWVLISGKPHTVCCKNPAGGPEIPARSAGLCALILVASTKHIAGGRGREPGDGAGVVQRRQHRREKEGWSQFIKHNVLTWIIFACSVSFDSAFTCSSDFLVEALTALQIVSKPTRSWSIAPTSGGCDDEREGGGLGA